MRHLLFVASLSAFACFAAAPSALAQQPTPAVSKEARSAADAAWKKQDYEAAATNYRKVVDADPKDGEAWHRLGFSLHSLGKLDEALLAHEKAATFPRFAGHGCYNAACVYALKGDKEKAIAWLDKAADAGLNLYDHIQTDTDMDAIRDDPRFAKILAKIEKNASGAAQPLQVYVQTTARVRNRAAWFGKNGSPGQITIEHAALPWKDEYEARVGSEQLMGKKWRLGSDYWTSLDSSLPMKLAGVEVPAGYYFLTLEQRDAKTFILALHDAAAVKKLKMDAYVADRLKGGIEVPLTHSTHDDVVVETLSIQLRIKPADQDHGTFDIEFGTHLLTAEATVALPK
ncbi:MAG: tetratricopeptide repeat protein [Planctomycetes bacterium]|nr:tetratricopeptide repeat protein [Planctomycetota bacterium]